jgi:KDO2-lipid IV(A) lauroyltransferase
MIDYLYLALYRLFTLLAKLLPQRGMDLILQGLAKFAYRVDRKHQHIVNANLKLAFGDTLSQRERDKIGVRVFYNLLQTIIGFMRRDGKSGENILRSVTFENGDIIENAIKNGKGIIFITAHYGNWELIPPALTSKFGLGLSIVGRKLDSEVMDRVLKRSREQFGVEMIYRKGAIKGMIKALKSQRGVGLLLDQHLGAKQGGIEVNFFGHKALQSPSASILARNFKIDIIPLFISTDNYRDYTLKVYPPLPYIRTENKERDIREMTQAQANIMEQVIREKPEEWFWVHRRWKGFYPEIYQMERR